MDWQAATIWISTISGIASLFVLFYLLPLNRKRIKSEIRKNNSEANKSDFEVIHDEMKRLREDYERKIKDLIDRVKRLENRNSELEKTNSLYRVAADNLGFWEKIKNEIERIRG